SKPRIWVAKPRESGIKKFIGGRGVPPGTLSIKGPAQDQFGKTITVSSQPSEPMVNERGLSDTGPGNDCNDVDIPVFPCTIQKRHILFSTKTITSGNRQTGYGNLLRCKSFSRLASSDTRSERGRLL